MARAQYKEQGAGADHTVNCVFQKPKSIAHQPHTTPKFVLCLFKSMHGISDKGKYAKLLITHTIVINTDFCEWYFISTCYLHGNVQLELRCRRHDCYSKETFECRVSSMLCSKDTQSFNNFHFKIIWNMVQLILLLLLITITFNKYSLKYFRAGEMPSMGRLSTGLVLFWAADLIEGWTSSKNWQVQKGKDFWLHL